MNKRYIPQILLIISSLIQYTLAGQETNWKKAFQSPNEILFHAINKDQSNSTFLDLNPNDDLVHENPQEPGLPVITIVGGQNADIADYPWTVALLGIAGTQICGGTILSSTWILTAAHCGTPTTIRAGVINKTDNTGQDRGVVSKINHPNYSGGPNYFNDIALVQLSSPLDFSDPKVQPIPIITQAHANDAYTDANITAVITGWGRLSFGGSTTNILQVAELPLVSNEDAYTYGWYNQNRITSDMICAGVLPDGGIDACQGDSGGPLVVPDPGSPLGYSVAGVTSWGTGCAYPNFPGVWSRVSYNETWLATTTGLSWSGPITPANPSDLEAEAVSDESILITWVKNTNNNEVLLIVSDTPEIGSPENGESYDPGDLIAGGGSVLYRGGDELFEHTGLQAGERRFYKIFSYNASFEYSIGRATDAATECLVYFNLPFIETFEESSLSVNCWTQIRETGPRFWSFGKGAGAGSITTARSGDRNARFSSSVSPSKVTKLVSPVLNLAHYEDVKLSFWYGQQAWGSDQNILKIFYKTGPEEPWVQIGSNYAGNISSWTQVQNIDLPNPSARYQIAFEGTDNYGRANVLDDIEITGTWVGPPSTLTLQDVLLENEDDECFAAKEQVFVAGSGTTFVVDEGASAVVVASQAIHFYDGTWIKTEGNLHAYIDKNGDFCLNHESLMSTNFLADYFSDDIIKSEELVADEKNAPSLRIYPNPSNGLVNIEISGIEEGASCQVEIFNLMGKMVHTSKLNPSALNTLELGHLNKGLFLIRINVEDRIMTQKLILQ